MKKALKTLTASVGAVGAFVSSATAFGVVLAEETDLSNIQINATQGYATSFENLFSFVLRAVLAIGALMVFAYLVWGGIEYITSGGEKGKTENARNKITAAVVGLIILASSWAILSLALSFLGIPGLEGVIQNVGSINKGPETVTE